MLLVFTFGKLFYKPR